MLSQWVLAIALVLVGLYLLKARKSASQQAIRRLFIIVALAAGLIAVLFPNYTNVSEGYGIFTGKTRSIAQNIRISTKTVDSMNVRPLTDSLRFSY